MHQLIISSLLFFFLFNPCVFAFSQGNSGKFQVAKYGGQLSSDASTFRAKKIFDRMKAVADKHADRYPELYLVASNELFAKSMIDGSILISRKALEFCYCYCHKSNRIDQSCLKTIRSDVNCLTNPDERECIGDSRLAFVMGHELAHLAFGDHGYGAKELYSTTKKSPTKHSKDFFECEHRADAYGMLYATMAGFHSFEDIRKQGRNFFQEWLDQLPALKRQCLNHPLPKLRINEVQEHMKRVKNYLNFFHMGSRLLYIGKYEKAIDFLSRFRSNYPGREVYNNIGCAYYQLAIQELMKYQPDIINRFYLSTPVDMQSGLDNTRPIISKSLQTLYQIKFNENIQKAIDNFEYACSKDPHYIPSVTNLSSCFLVKQKYNLALSEIEKVNETNNPFLLNNKAVSEYLSSKESESSMCILAKILKDKPDFYPACFNLTRMIAETKMPNAYSSCCADIISEAYSSCKKMPQNTINHSKQKSIPGQLFTRPVQLGEITKKVQKYLSKMKCQSDNLGYYTVDFCSETFTNVLVLGTRLEIVESIFKPPFKSISILNNYQKPKRLFFTASDVQILVYEKLAVEVEHDNIIGVIFF